MRYVVYIDVFFAINFFMDFLVLAIVRKAYKPQTTLLRCFPAAMAGAALSCIAVMTDFGSMAVQKIFTYVVIASVMTVTGFSVKNIKSYFRVMVTLYGITFALSGAVNGLYYFTGSGMFIERGINIVRFIFITVTAYFITVFLVKAVKNRINGSKEHSDIYTVTLVYDGKSVQLKGLYDSGNSLREPISGMPVHIANYAKIKQLTEGVNADSIKIRLVPYKAIGTNAGIIKAIQIDEIWLNIEGENIKTDNELIGIYEGTLSQTGEYDIILNRSIKKWL